MTKTIHRFALAVLAAAIVAGCAGVTPEPDVRDARGPIIANAPQIERPDTEPLGDAPVRFQTLQPASSIAAAAVPSTTVTETVGITKPEGFGPPHERPVSEKEIAARKEESRRLAPSSRAQNLNFDRSPPLVSQATGFDAIDVTKACPTCLPVPPDPDVAVSDEHVLVGVNVSVAVYDKATGALAAGFPKFLRDLFAGVEGCDFITFDPNILYDEEHDRFVVGADGFGTHYCIAVSATDDPTGAWHRYSIQTGDDLVYFDYPQSGVGDDAIYMGANLFSNVTFGYIGSRVWALEKQALYDGTAANAVSHPTGFASSPQPVHLEGFRRGTWPTGGPHWLIANDEAYDGANYAWYEWHDPFDGSGGTFTRTNTIDLVAATGVDAGYPLPAPQPDGGTVLPGDYSPLDAAYRNGSVWTSMTIACNPGEGTVACVRWAEIDPASGTVATVRGEPNAGVYASDGEHRYYPEIVTNHCGTTLVAYTKSGESTRHTITVAGRLGVLPAGKLLDETELAASTVAYRSFQTPPQRWGDYLGLAVDPEGTDFWHAGQYAKELPGVAVNWGTQVFRIPAVCPGDGGGRP